MQRFSLSAKLFICTVIVAGALSFGYAYSLEKNLPDSGLLIGLCVASIIAHYTHVRLFYKPNAGENNSKMSLGFVPTFFTLLAFGPLTGMIVGVVGYTVSSLYPRRPYFYQILFSLFAVAIATLAAGIILRQVGLAPGDLRGYSFTDAGYWWTLLRQLPFIFSATLVYYLINTGLVATAIALSTGKQPLPTWRSHFLWTGPGYFAGASCATIVFALGVGDRLRVSENWILLLLVAVVAAPILVVTFLSYKTYMDKVHANERHILELQRGQEELQRLYMSTVESLAHAIDAKDRYTKEHIQRVQSVAVAIAREMGLSGDELRGIETGALLHDIGKLGIPEHILAKPGRLTPEEFEQIKGHPVIGSKILEPVHFPWPVLPAVRSHHERWDGQGYPDGLAAEEIPLCARIMAVADVYDAVTSDRAYRAGWSHEKASAHIRDNAGTHFDPQVVTAFLQVMERNPHIRCNVSSDPPFLTGANERLRGKERGPAPEDGPPAAPAPLRRVA